MAFPYILEEKSVLRKQNSTKTITEVIQEAHTWVEELQGATSLDNKYFYANVFDSETQKKYNVYSVSAVEYFELENGVVELGGGTPISVNGASNVDVGAVMWFATATAPNLYFQCDGRELVKTEFSELYSVIGDTFGSTEATFNIPDLRDEFVRGASDTRAVGLKEDDMFK
ncbi:MAG: phage tail protein, partial [Campylobacterota bacterium]|nr:phage tail protein [Campylobacterota bacterium]